MTNITLTGSAASPGIAIGPALIYHARARTHHPSESEHDEHEKAGGGRTSSIPTAEIERLRSAIATADTAMAAAETQLLADGQEEESHIFGAHRLLLTDPELRDLALTLILEEGQHADEAIVEAGEDQAEVLENLSDPLLKARAIDVRDVVAQVRRILNKEATLGERLTEPSIIIANELGPAELMSAPRDRLLGIVLASGAPGGHATILARAWGVPAITGVGKDIMAKVKDGALVCLDGASGQVVVEPDDAALAQMRARAEVQAARQAEMRGQRDLPSVTSDGKHIMLLVNLSSLSGAQIARDWGVEGVGSLRTELLFLGHPSIPDEEEQIEFYHSVAAELPGVPIYTRTLDIGGDKPIPNFPLPYEDNPFLGWRGIRIGLTQSEELLLPQLRAMLRAAATDNIHIMIPMITTLSEWRQVRTHFNRAIAELHEAGLPCAANPQLGVLVETPAAALIADSLAREADFISLGTNDLTQYALACDRTNPRVASLYQPLEPAVLFLIKRTIDAGHKYGHPVTVCGEMASDPALAPLLIGMGVDGLSCTPPAIPLVRNAIRATSAAAACEMAQAALQATTLAEVQAIIYDQPL
jgi:phosphoenolpyruvate-protein phosphotransferase